ncbi:MULTISPECIES: spore cortex-lytic enzyme [Bacillus]|uniref:Spore cortex-lytic enzyme n=1 Tax=Bacillus cereus TaxID=1396 RepID=A0A2C1MCC1_BACCE|nr:MULTISPECIES: spore cortex-lytic enzyme [Bacillus]MDH4421688.1 spore cortex-lytic enzyme [Bacillus cereus]PER30110.1 spore cortex-lytic enzyme [Bacillus cereus]PFA65942.1 spore cortex-lytic enzyme [Bacillus sp. AFS015896]PGL83096.1 spore cortex-lytic enzyme [Bacillus sp. AFS054943]PGU07852.1 spore cortex-lytic enzyme [Bacillus cereus]
MRKKAIFKIAVLLAFIGLSLMVSSIQLKNVEAFSNQVIQRGASGEDVIELQSRLKYNGFYTGKVDGVFGWGTYWALRNFQEKFGLPVDGLAGAATKQKLVKATKYDKSTANKGTTTNKGNSSGTAQENKPPQSKGTNVPNGYSQNDIQLMANAVYGESRGEPYLGQVAVAAVILNRVTSASFPNTVSGVIFEPRAFTAVADGQIYLTPNETAKKAVLDAINGWDPTGNALYYFNPETATSKWIWSRPQIKKIGKHIFCK